MKAGAAFTALEWTIPDGRIKLICDQLKRIDVVLSSPSQKEKIGRLGKPVIIVDETTTSKLNIADNNSIVLVDVAVNPNDLAYVIFTSGSTGE